MVLTRNIRAKGIKKFNSARESGIKRVENIRNCNGEKAYDQHFKEQIKKLKSFFVAKMKNANG